MPEISALLTTHNRASLLPRVLEGLERQSLDASRFEIVAIDDGSTDATQWVLDAWRDRLPLRIVRQNQAGLAAAKNLGVFLARAPLLVFLDDDDVAEPDLLVAHLAAHIASPDQTVAVLGRTTLAPDIAAMPVMRHVTEVGCQLFSYGSMTSGQVMDHTAFWGGRSSCKRGLLVRNGVFHPDFRFGCEDIELGYRLARHGLRVIYEPAAHTVMIRAIGFDQFCARSYRQGRSQYRFAQMHADPQVRAYCEIEPAGEAWAHRRGRYAAHLRWTRQLDRLAAAREQAGLPSHPVLQPVLDAAYREAFFLSRAKGIADAAALTPVPQAMPRQGARSMLEYGLAPAC
ncbi:glycosyltransferase [Roseomonas sp. OT10]|uniref:glycosyltransferase family 2 protein n=1 Tax=Roseomonas cutis TaxID=2897332 RepID=UPI001E61E840|nr:glycosyltransferase family 2 protein [Roseomonas sp. OT10]UFN47218.1 glycosyltransferase [Roseomonas sp. OT10]